MKIKLIMFLFSYFDRVVQLWRTSLAKVNEKAAQCLADPTEYENLFTGLQDAFKTEQFLSAHRSTAVPAAEFSQVTVSLMEPTWVVEFFMN